MLDYVLNKIVKELFQLIWRNRPKLANNVLHVWLTFVPDAFHKKFIVKTNSAKDIKLYTWNKI